ncbi:hypothetical protein N0V88_006767 [Collariella sp. IMI 366227]|nr:hypothetical protein N0V88_006767 [Collariella sp. IMI 366227]
MPPPKPVKQKKPLPLQRNPVRAVRGIDKIQKGSSYEPGWEKERFRMASKIQKQETRIEQTEAELGQLQKALIYQPELLTFDHYLQRRREASACTAHPIRYLDDVHPASYRFKANWDNLQDEIGYLTESYCSRKIAWYKLAPAVQSRLLELASKVKQYLEGGKARSVCEAFAGRILYAQVLPNKPRLWKEERSPAPPSPTNSSHIAQFAASADLAMALDRKHWAIDMSYPDHLGQASGFPFDRMRDREDGFWMMPSETAHPEAAG